MNISNLIESSDAPVRSVRGEVRLRGLTKSYQIGGRTLPVLAGIDLDIAAGEFVSIVGRSGCGKSTLLRLISGLDRDHAGDMWLDDAPIIGTSLDCGMVFQDSSLFPWMTLRSNIAFALQGRADLSDVEKTRRVTDAIDLVRLTEFGDAWPRQLSGGMAQRGAIARALVNEPGLLLLDEPFGALDALTRTYLQRELQHIWLRQRSTMILVTHDVEEAVFLSDRIVVMDAAPGRIHRIVPVPLSHPRDPADPAVQRIKETILIDLVGD